MSYSLAQAVIRSTTPAMVWLDRWPFTTEPGLLLAPCKIPLPVEAVVFYCAGYVWLGLLGSADDSSEGLWFSCSQLSQDFTVKLDVLCLEAGH